MKKSQKSLENFKNQMISNKGVQTIVGGTDRRGNGNNPNYASSTSTSSLGFTDRRGNGNNPS